MHAHLDSFGHPRISRSYGSLWQKMLPDANGLQVDDRTPELLVQFGLGLRASNVWYGHAWTVTLVQPHLPEGFEALCQAEGRPFLTYAASGWCFVEASLSSLVKVGGYGARRIDIGKYTTGSYNMQPLMSMPYLTDAMLHCSSATRPPPMLPSKVAAELDTKSFFSTGDIPKVAQLYEAFFDAVAPSQTVLELRNLDWGAAEAAVLAAALPRFERLVTLDVSNNMFDPEGAKALAEALRANSSLTDLKVKSCGIRDEGASAIAMALKANVASKVATLNLSYNGIGDEGAEALAALCVASGSLTKLDIQGNHSICEKGKTALREAREALWQEVRAGHGVALPISRAKNSL